MFDQISALCAYIFRNSLHSFENSVDLKMLASDEVLASLSELGLRDHETVCKDRPLEVYILKVLITGLPQALEIMENLENHHKNPCM